MNCGLKREIKNVCPKPDDRVIRNPKATVAKSLLLAEFIVLHAKTGRVFPNNQTKW